MTNIEIINKAESIINDPKRPEVLPLEDIGTISAALGIARILTRRTADYDKAREEYHTLPGKSICVSTCGGKRLAIVIDVEAALSERGGTDEADL